MYITVDGDDIGKSLDKYIFSGDIQALQNFKNSFDDELIDVIDKLKYLNIEIVFVGGDSIIGFSKNSINPSFIQEVFRNSAFSWSVGIGMSLQNAALALKKAKALGKNRIEHV